MNTDIDFDASKFVFKPYQWKLIRRASVQFLYQLQVHEQMFFQERDISIFFSQGKLDSDLHSAVTSLVSATLKHLARVDELLSSAAQNWKLSRMARVDLAVLRICATEILLRRDVPPAVILSDAVDIAQEFGSEHSRGFVNGVLDAVRKKMG